MRFAYPSVPDVLRKPVRLGSSWGPGSQGSPPEGRTTLGCAAKRFQRNVRAGNPEIKFRKQALGSAPTDGVACRLSQE